MVKERISEEIIEVEKLKKKIIPIEDLKSRKRKIRDDHMLIQSCFR